MILRSITSVSPDQYFQTNTLLKLNCWFSGFIDPVWFSISKPRAKTVRSNFNETNAKSLLCKILKRIIYASTRRLDNLIFLLDVQNQATDILLCETENSTNIPHHLATPNQILYIFSIENLTGSSTCNNIKTFSLFNTSRKMSALLKRLLVVLHQSQIH